MRRSCWRRDSWRPEAASCACSRGPRANAGSREAADPRGHRPRDAVLPIARPWYTEGTKNFPDETCRGAQRLHDYKTRVTHAHQRLRRTHRAARPRFRAAGCSSSFFFCGAASQRRSPRRCSTPRRGRRRCVHACSAKRVSMDKCREVLIVTRPPSRRACECSRRVLAG